MKKNSGDRLGVWLFGALGGLATTVVTGARAMARGLAEARGLVSATPLVDGLPLASLDQLVFGGHEVRQGSPLESAREIARSNGSLPLPVVETLKKDLDAYGARIRLGTLANAGRTIRKLAGAGDEAPTKTLREQLDTVIADIREFMLREKLTRCVCVNLCSTEPKLAPAAAHKTLAALERAIDQDQVKAVRPTTLYALAAARLGLPFVHFTPSDAALLPATRALFVENGVPFAGRDGKTGETLVKTALAPLFRYRDLRVLSWQGYNMLGDRDGVVLADDENKATKVESKDKVLAKVLGYAPHSKVGIDYVPSLGDLKTAWDFIHFEGFLGFRMSLQFTWQGCDAILAAPLVLDLVRLIDLAHRLGEKGAMADFAVFFKQPIGSEEQDLHRQWEMLGAWLQRMRALSPS
ncbi:MAG: inositol-3-phosphate synthase [Planctomycetota bacterium]